MDFNIKFIELFRSILILLILQLCQQENIAEISTYRSQVYVQELVKRLLQREMLWKYDLLQIIQTKILRLLASKGSGKK